MHIAMHEWTTLGRLPDIGDLDIGQVDPQHPRPPASWSRFASRDDEGSAKRRKSACSWFYSQ